MVFNYYSLSEQSGTLGDDRVTDSEAAVYDILFPVVLSEERHGGGFRLAVDDTIDKRAVLQFIRCLLRNHNTVGAVRRHNDGRATAIMQHMAAVGEGGTQRDGTRLGIDGTADGTDAPSLTVFLTVAQPQLYGRLQWVVYPEYLNTDVEAEAEVVTKWRARPII